MANKKKGNKTIPQIPGMLIREGFCQAYNDLFTSICYDCGPLAVVVYLTILRHYNRKTKECYPTVSVIMAECDLTKNTVERYIKLLYENHYLLIDSGNKERANKYYFPQEKFFDPMDMPCLPKKREGRYLKKKAPKKNTNTKERAIQELQEELKETKQKVEANNKSNPLNILKQNPGEKNLTMTVEDDGVYSTWYTGYDKLDRPDRYDDVFDDSVITGVGMNQTKRREIFNERQKQKQLQEEKNKKQKEEQRKRLNEIYEKRKKPNTNSWTGDDDDDIF